MSPSAPATDLDLPVIEVKNLTKTYRLGALEGLRATAKRLLGKPVDAPQRHFKALDDVSFSVRRGEVVGIIGHNGAGKSTLLKHLCRITTPTSGSVIVRCRVAPLIEVGAGLVGEMTGRENIYLNATILGLRRAEIESKIDEIIQFAELERFIDTPIKRYSSGMQVRLGYAIATAVESEVLIVDEVLAVGDLQFQRKSIERMQSLIRTSQRTVLIVGHNVRQLERVCTRVIMLSEGRLTHDGLPSIVINEYYEKIQQKEVESARGSGGGSSSPNWIIETSGEVFVDDVKMRQVSDDVLVDRVQFGAPFDIEIKVRSSKPIERVDVGIAFQTLDHLPVAISELTSAGSHSIAIDKVSKTLRCRFYEPSLMPGVYSMRVGIKDSWGQLVWGANNVAPFEVFVGPDENRARYSDFAFVKFRSTWDVVS